MAYERGKNVKSFETRAGELVQEANESIGSSEISLQTDVFRARGISDKFFRAGELYQRAGKYLLAENAYKDSINCAPYKSYRLRAQAAIDSLNKTEIKPTKKVSKHKYSSGGYAQQREEDDSSDVDSAVKRWKSRNSSKSERERSFSELLSGLEKKAKDFPDATLSFMAIATLLASLFFVSSSLTGFAVSNFTTDDLQWAGICFFACGLVFAFLFLRKKYSVKK
jgi:hypothetical protein